LTNTGISDIVAVMALKKAISKPERIKNEASISARVLASTKTTLTQVAAELDRSEAWVMETALLEYFERHQAKK
jgi:hypothetical protein